MTARQLARASNDFEPSPKALPLTALRTTREVAELLALEPASVRARAVRHGVRRILIGNVLYWTPSQVERLRGLS